MANNHSLVRWPKVYRGTGAAARRRTQHGVAPLPQRLRWRNDTDRRIDAADLLIIGSAAIRGSRRMRCLDGLSESSPRSAVRPATV